MAVAIGGVRDLAYRKAIEYHQGPNFQLYEPPQSIPDGGHYFPDEVIWRLLPRYHVALRSTIEEQSRNLSLLDGADVWPTFYGAAGQAPQYEWTVPRGYPYSPSLRGMTVTPGNLNLQLALVITLPPLSHDLSVATLISQKLQVAMLQSEELEVATLISQKLETL